jgi:hypothetical protein
MKYKLNVSYNCGTSYRVERESNNLEELKEAGKKLDEQMLRWDIEDEDGEPIACCAIHKDIFNFMEAVNRQEVKKFLVGVSFPGDSFIVERFSDLASALEYAGTAQAWSNNEWDQDKESDPNVFTVIDDSVLSDYTAKLEKRLQNYWNEIRRQEIFEDTED